MASSEISVSANNRTAYDSHNDLSEVGENLLRLFSIRPDGKFQEYVETPFSVHHDESVLEQWLENNPDGITEDGPLLIIGRQVAADFGGFIDLLAIDQKGDVVVIELKRGKTPRDTLAQALEYISFAAQLDSMQLEAVLRTYLNDESLSLAEYHRTYYELTEDDAVAFNKGQRIVIMGQKVFPQIRQTASFLRTRGLRITCVEFSFFQGECGSKLFAQEVVVGDEPERPTQVSSGSLPIISEAEFLESLDDNGRLVFMPLLQYARDKSMPIHWGTKGFSLNVDLEGTHVAVCFGYPPNSVYRQSIYTALMGRGGMAVKSAVPVEKVSDLWDKAKESGLFEPAGRDLKLVIDRKVSEDDLSKLFNWLDKVVQAIRAHGLKE